MVGAPARIGIIGGSGLDLSGIFDHIATQIPFAEAGLPASTVSGHACKMMAGRVAGAPVLLQCGRPHLYEGNPAEMLRQPLDWMRRQGVQALILTNAAGGLRPEWDVGTLVAAESIFTWPCRRLELPRRLAPELVLESCPCRGVYGWVHGPCYETRAEIRALQALGVDAVGMSAGPELAFAQEMGLPAAVVSCITNNCCMPRRLTHKHVLNAARNASEALTVLLREELPVVAARLSGAPPPDAGAGGPTA